ncbi:Abi family protein, partial [Legionella pneumophila]|nr:Abi family protein [Legionella pneumophila]
MKTIRMNTSFLVALFLLSFPALAEDEAYIASMMFNNIQSKDVRNEIASFLGQHTTVIESWIKSLTYTRNLCAHH